MKIYFAGAIRGGRQNQDQYYQIIKHLENYGQVLTEHVGDINVKKKEISNTDSFIYQRDISWIKKSNVLIADVTVPSLGVGYEISFAEKLKIPILCLFNTNSNLNLSAMISGNNNIISKKYSNFVQVKEIIDNFLKNC